MFESRKWQKVVLQLILTILAVPFLLPLIAMVQVPSRAPVGTTIAWCWRLATSQRSSAIARSLPFR